MGEQSPSDSARTRAIGRAVRQIAAHPSVSAVAAVPGEYGGYVAEIMVRMPTRWAAGGASPGGVRPNESVRFAFPPEYPLRAPGIWLRGDFSREHPHLLPGRPDEPPAPCYFEGDPDDLLRLRGIHGVVTQVADWLEKAAAFALIDPEQGWEPARRDRCDDSVEMDVAQVRTLATAGGGSAFLGAPYGSIGRGDGLSYLLAITAERVPLSEPVMRAVLGEGRRLGLALAVWAGRSAAGGPGVDARYAPENVATVGDLHARAAASGMGGQLSSALSLVSRRLASSDGEAKLVLAVLLLVRRPFPLIGAGSEIEVLPYVVEAKRGTDLGAASVHPVRLAAARDALSAGLLARMAGRAPASGLWTLLGAGSLGSKIGLHLAREGRAPGLVVDRSLMFAHNFARHGLVPGVMERDLDGPKAQAMINAVGALGQKCAGVCRDMVQLAAAGGSDLAACWPDGTGFVLDATGSAAVTGALCLPSVKSRRPRAIECSLYGGGRVAFLSIEGPACNPDLQDLSAEAFRLMAADAAAGDVALGTPADTVGVGQGCSTVTARMTDAALSAPCPAMSARISSLIDEGLPEDGGEVLLGLVEADLLGQSWQAHAVPPCTRLLAADGGASVSVAARVVASIDAQIAARPGVETGGVLLGRYNEATDSHHVVGLMPPPPDSAFGREEFRLGMDGLGADIRETVRRTNGALYPLGTWHNHLADTPPSPTDLATGALLAFGQEFPALLLIRAPGRFVGLIAERYDGHGEGADAARLFYLEET